MKFRTKNTKSSSYNEFLKQGGGRSGVYDISDKRTKSFVRKYRRYIPKREIYTRDKRGYLVPKYRRYKR